MVTRCSPKVGLELPGALPVDIEQNVAALSERLLHGRFWGPVAMAEHVRPFDELVRTDHPVELGIIDEVIVGAFDFAGTYWPGGRGDRHCHLGVSRK